MAESNTVYNPPIPHVSVVPDGVFPGRAIIIKGVVLSGGNKGFAINLCCGLLVEGDHTDDKALHLNARFEPQSWFGSSDRDIVLNSLINNRWGAEERYANVFQEGQQFQIRILALVDGFKIAVNGKHLGDYQHRVSLDSVRTIYVSGNIQVDFIEYQGERQQPQPSAPLQQEPSPSLGSSGSIMRPLMPFSLPLNGAFVQPRQLHITGTPKMTADDFSIDLCAGKEIFMHMRVYFKPKCEIVRNSTKKGAWLQEERDLSRFPFLTGSTFDVIIAPTSEFCKVTVNGAHLFIFKFRNSPSDVDRVNINGDLSLQMVELL